MSNIINPITETNLGKIWHRGKVRDTYEINNTQLLMISTDRISAFDVVLNDSIPGKGIILTEMSKFWFSKLSDVVQNHFANIPTNNDIKGISKDELSRGIIVNKETNITYMTLKHYSSYMMCYNDLNALNNIYGAL